MSRLIRVAIVDPHDVFRRALEELLASETELRATTFTDPVAMTATDRLGSFAVVLADERSLGASSGTARSALADVARRTTVVVMGMREHDYYADAAIDGGAVGYWPKFGEIDALLALIRAAGLVTEVRRERVASRARTGGSRSANQAANASSASCQA